jgi:PAS domain-containing protein
MKYEFSLKSQITPKSPKGDCFKLLILCSFLLGIKAKNKKNQQFEGFFDQNEVPVIVRNVSERLKARQIILENLANLRAIMESTDDLPILPEADGIIIEFNEVHANRLGFTKDEIIGINVFDLMQGDVSASRKALIQKVIHTGKTS